MRNDLGAARRFGVATAYSDCVPSSSSFTDLMILGGLELCVSQYLCHPQSGLRWRAAQLIASCAQNMPQVQVHLLSMGALPKLLQLTDSDPHPTVRVKALYAVSCEYFRALVHSGRHCCKIQEKKHLDKIVCIKL